MFNSIYRCLPVVIGVCRFSFSIYRYFCLSVFYNIYQFYEAKMSHGIAPNMP